MFKYNIFMVCGKIQVGASWCVLVLLPSLFGSGFDHAFLSPEFGIDVVLTLGLPQHTEPCPLYIRHKALSGAGDTRTRPQPKHQTRTFNSLTLGAVDWTAIPNVVSLQMFFSPCWGSSYHCTVTNTVQSL